MSFKTSSNELENIVKKIKKQSNKDYDCLIGISRRLIEVHFSTLCQRKSTSLNPLVLHVDTGWNSIESVNIERIIDKLNLDLVTIVVPWKEMKDLQLSFLKRNIQI